MPGQAIVTIGQKSWEVYLATTVDEVTQGLAGLSSIPEGTGMFFDTGYDQPIQITTENMQFAIDIAFISSDMRVVDIIQHFKPGNTVLGTDSARYFLEVNAGELAGVKWGDAVSVNVIQAQQAMDPNSIFTFMVTMMMMWFMYRTMLSMIRGPRKKTTRGALPPGYTRLGGRRLLVERSPQTRGKQKDLEEKWYRRGFEAGKLDYWMTLEEALDEALSTYTWRPRDAESLVNLAQDMWEETDYFNAKYGLDMMHDAEDALESRRGMSDYGLDVGTLHLELVSEFWQGYIQGRKAIGIDIYQKAERLMSGRQPQTYMPQTKRQDVMELPFAGAVGRQMWWVATVDNKTVTVMVKGTRRAPERDLERYFTDSVAIVSKEAMDHKGLKFALAKDGAVQWLDLSDHKLIVVKVVGIASQLQTKHLEDIFSHSTAMVEGASPEYLPKTGELRLMPKLPKEAKDNEEFVSYIRDVVELGQPLTEEEVKHLWMAWKIMVQKGYYPQTKMAVYCPICGKEVPVPGYDSMTRTDALREHIQAEHQQQTRGSPKYQAQTAKLTRDDVEVDAWQERDRLGIWVTDRHTGKAIAEWWDEDARQMFEDGFFKPGVEPPSHEFVDSVLDHLEDIGVLAKEAEGPSAPERPGNFILHEDRMGNIILEYSEGRGKDVLLQFEVEKAVIYDILKEQEERDLNAGWEVRIAARDPRASVLEELWQYAAPKQSPQTKRKPAVTPKGGRRQRHDSGIEYYADSPEFMTQTVDLTGYRDKISQTFQEAIKRAKRGKRK